MLYVGTSWLAFSMRRVVTGFGVMPSCIAAGYCTGPATWKHDKEEGDPLVESVLHRGDSPVVQLNLYRYINRCSLTCMMQHYII